MNIKFFPKMHACIEIISLERQRVLNGKQIKLVAKNAWLKKQLKDHHQYKLIHCFIYVKLAT